MPETYRGIIARRGRAIGVYRLSKDEFLIVACIDSSDLDQVKAEAALRVLRPTEAILAEFESLDNGYLLVRFIGLARYRMTIDGMLLRFNRRIDGMPAMLRALQPVLSAVCVQPIVPF